jgi:tetratricopeptide (TPR) repeat protein
MMSNTTERIEHLRQSALSRVRSGDYEDALALYDQALAIASAEDVRELITINKADALIALERNGPEVQALPAILMRRRNLHHTFLAAYALMFRHRIQTESKRAIFYGHVALDAATEADEPFWKIAALNDLGIIYEIDSQFEEAIHCFEQALPLLEHIENPAERALSHTAILQNLGYNKLLVGNTREGIGTILSVLDSVESPSARAESYIDLCYGYLELGEHEKARFYGEAGLSLANESRQIRNAHYLLGEASYKTGDEEAAEYHFGELARYYPQFRNLKSLLFAIDLRGMVNLKL